MYGIQNYTFKAIPNLKNNRTTKRDETMEKINNHKARRNNPGSYFYGNLVNQTLLCDYICKNRELTKLKTKNALEVYQRMSLLHNKQINQLDYYLLVYKDTGKVYEKFRNIGAAKLFLVGIPIKDNLKIIINPKYKK